MPVNLSPQNRDYLIRTVIGEAANQPRLGQAAVAHTILNRRNAGQWGDSVQDVVMSPNQFEPWQTRADELRGISPESGVYQNAGQLVDQVLAGDIPDPTEGGTYFLNPEIVRQRRGGSLPSWATNETASIGDHTFYRGGPEGASRNGRDDMPPRQTLPLHLRSMSGVSGMPGMQPGKANTVQAGQALPTKQAQSVQPLDIPSGPSQGRRRLAENLIKNSHQMGANTAGNPTALWGAIAQNLSGNLMSGLNDEATDERRKALAQAVNEASGNPDQLIKTLTASGDPQLMNAAIKARLSSAQPEKKTAKYRDYLAAKREGYEGGFADFLGKFGSGVDVNVGGKGETEFAKKYGGSLAEEVIQLGKEADAAADLAGSYQQIEDLLNDPDVYTGAGGGLVNYGKKVGATLFGQEQFEGVEEAEAANKTQKLLVGKIREMMGDTRMSDADRQFYSETIPNISDSARGIALTTQIAKQAADHKRKLERKALEIMDANNGVMTPQAWSQFREWQSDQSVFDPNLMEMARSEAETAEQQDPGAGITVELDGQNYRRNPQTGDWEIVE